jgi:hypothetical protein
MYHGSGLSTCAAAAAEGLQGTRKGLNSRTCETHHACLSANNAVAAAPLLLPPCAPHQGGVERLAQLRVLYLSNNKIREWTELDRLAALERLEDVLLVSIEHMSLLIAANGLSNP